MKDSLSKAGKVMIDQLSLNANFTASTPLESQLQTLSMLQVFLDTILITIVAFLAILDVQLMYSLMLSDVEEKTFEYGMLRALGFNQGNIMATVFI